MKRYGHQRTSTREEYHLYQLIPMTVIQSDLETIFIHTMCILNSLTLINKGTAVIRDVHSKVDNIVRVVF